MIKKSCYFLVRKNEDKAIFFDIDHNVVSVIFITDEEKTGKNRDRLYRMLDTEYLNHFRPATIKIKRKSRSYRIHYLDKYGDVIFRNKYPQKNVGDLKTIVEFEKINSSNRANIDYKWILDNDVPIIIDRNRKKKCSIM